MRSAHEHRKRYPLLALLFMAGMTATTTASAQISNGSFDQGAIGWTWKSARSSSLVGPGRSCVDAALNPWQPPHHLFADHAGQIRAAKLVSAHNTGFQLEGFCTDASQIFTLPTTPKDLVFKYKLGNVVPSYATIQHPRDVFLSVVVEPTDGSPSVSTFIRQGVSARDAGNGYCVGECPEWRDARVSLAQFAGKTVKVRIVSESAEARVLEQGGYPQSPAYIDDVGLADAAVACSRPSSQTPNEGWYLDWNKPNTALQVSPRGESLILGWLTFEQGGTPVWYFALPTLDGCGEYSGALSRYQMTGGVVHSTEIGSVTLNFAANGGGSFHYTVQGQSRSTSIGYYQFGYNYGALDLTGFYADANRANSGTYVVSQNDTHLVANYVFDAGGNPVWTFGQGQTSNSALYSVPMYVYYGSGRCPLCTGPVGNLGVSDLGAISLFPLGYGALQISGDPVATGSGYSTALWGAGIDWPFNSDVHGKL